MPTSAVRDGYATHVLAVEKMPAALPRDQTFNDFVVDHEFPRIGRCRLILNARQIIARPGEAPLILLAMEDAPTV